VNEFYLFYFIFLLLLISSIVMVEDSYHTSFFIVRATGSSVGSTQLGEKTTEIIHASMFKFLYSSRYQLFYLVGSDFLILTDLCGLSRYSLKEKSDDNILLILIIHIMDVLANYGNAHCV
jgi:hypothetical protein